MKNYALQALSRLVAAGMDGVFLDGMITFEEGCEPGKVDINCSSPDCHGTPTNVSEWGPRWFPRIGEWFDALKAQYPKLLWINNGPYPGDTPEPKGFEGMGEWARRTMNGRMIEPNGEAPDGRGLLTSYEMRQPITKVMEAVAEWTDTVSSEQPQPTYVSTHMAVPHFPAVHVGLWQNAVSSSGDMMRAGVEFQAMRYGLGVTLLTDAYFANSLVVGAFYGVPTWYAEYEADLGFPTGVAKQLAGNGSVGEVWAREFDRGLVVVNGLADRAVNFTLPRTSSDTKYFNLAPSQRPQRITGGYEAPLHQFVVDNEAPYCGVVGPSALDWSPMACGFKAVVDYGQGPPAPPAMPLPGSRNCSVTQRQNATDSPIAKSKMTTKHPSAVQVGTIDACCELCVSDDQCTGWVWDTIAHDPTTGSSNCWLLSSYAKEHSIPQRIFGSVGSLTPATSPAPYQWNAITGNHHQVGGNYLTNVVVDGSDWSQQPIYTAVWSFRVPSSGLYRFSTSRVSSAGGGVAGAPLTNAAPFCLRARTNASATTTTCIGRGTVDQRGGSGGWVRVMSGVGPLHTGVRYEMVLTHDWRQGGFAAADAILVESEAVLNDGAQLDEAQPLIIPPLDARIVRKRNG